MAKILIVEDDQDLAVNVGDWLKGQRHTVDHVSNGQDALHMLKFCNYDLIVLDWILPGLDGVSLCKQFRSKNGSVPILILTGKKEMDDKEQGLDAGADDYLTKPFELRELSARIRALLRRPPRLIAGTIEIGNIVLDPQARIVLKSGEELHLPPIEFALLEFFMRHPNQIFSGDALLERVWSSSSDASPDVVRKTVNKLRARIDEEGTRSLIRTIHGVGYGLETPK